MKNTRRKLKSLPILPNRVNDSPVSIGVPSWMALTIVRLGRMNERTTRKRFMAKPTAERKKNWIRAVRLSEHLAGLRLGKN